MAKPTRHAGGYRSLVAFQMSTVIYDATVSFCDQFIDGRSRTVDQMVQAARSGRQNIAEGSRSGAFDPETERRLTNVARASLEELLLDYEDYLRQHHLPQWGRGQAETMEVRDVWRTHHSDQADKTPVNMDWRALDDEHLQWYSKWLKGTPAAVQANAVICLINQANYRLDQLLHADSSDDAEEMKNCPICGAEMVLRQVKSGPNEGNSFWGCSRYPACKGTRRA